MATKTRTSAESTEAPETGEEENGESGEAQINPRTAKAQQKLQNATDLIRGMLETAGDEEGWVSSNDIHRAFADQISEGMYGRVKAALGIEHRRVKPEGAEKPEYQWRLPRAEASA